MQTSIYLLSNSTHSAPIHLDEESHSEAVYWNCIALLCSTTGSFFTAIGLITLKLANMACEGKPDAKVWQQWRFYFALFLMGNSQLFNGFAIGLGNIILISSTSCLTIVFTAILSPIILKEKFVWIRDGVTILLVGSGSATAVTQQPLHLPVYFDKTVNEEMMYRLFRPVALSYYAFLIFLVILRNLMFFRIKTILSQFHSNVMVNYIKVKNEEASNNQATNLESLGSSAQILSTGSSPENGNKIVPEYQEEGSEVHAMPSIRILIKVISTHELSELHQFQGIQNDPSFWSLHAWSRLFLLCQNLLSGIFVGLTSCMGKIFLISCAHTHGAWGWIVTPCVWVSGLSVTFTIFANLYNLNLTVSMYSQLVTMPTYECCIIFGTLLGGGFVMGEFSYYTHQELVIIACGSCICMLGIMYKVCMIEHGDIEENEEEETDESKALYEQSQNDDQKTGQVQEPLMDKPKKSQKDPFKLVTEYLSEHYRNSESKKLI